MVTTDKFDDLLTKLSTGWWNVMFIFSTGYWYMILVSNILSMPFVAPALNHTCVPRGNGHTLTSTTFNTIDSNTTTVNNCRYYTNDTEGGGFEEKACSDWIYDNSTYTLTLTSQFDLVCSREYIRPTYQSLYMFGTFVGAPINGLTSDRFGRKTTLSLGVLTYFFIAISSCWLTSLPAILTFRFILGFIHPAILQTGYILDKFTRLGGDFWNCNALEVCEPKYRSIVGVLASFPWTIGTMIWGGVAYLIRDWRWLQLAVNIPGLLIVPILLILDESPRWLIVRGRFEKASKTLYKAARWNHVTLPPQEELHSLMHAIRQEANMGKSGMEKQKVKRAYREKVTDFLLHLLILFRTHKLRTITCFLCLKFFLVSLIFYGIALNAVNFSANPFLYMILSGVVEVPAYVVSVPIVARCGRKWPSIVFYFISGVVIVAVAFIPSDMKVMVLVLALMGRMCITAADVILYLYCVELYPTEVRLQGLGYCTIFSRTGSMMSPFITELLGPVYPSAPSLVFGLGALVAGLATLPLPETLNRKLPDTIADLENKSSEFIRLENCGMEKLEEEGEEVMEDEESKLAKLRT